MTTRRPSSPHSTPAFTLTEMLLAITLTAMMVAAIVDSVMRSSDFYQRHSGELDRAAAARQVLDTLTLDLSTAILRSGDDEIWMAAELLDDSSNSGRWMPGGKPPRGALDLDPPQPKEEPEPPKSEGNRLHSLPRLAPLPEYRFGQAGVWLRFFAMPEDRDGGVAYRGTQRQAGDINAMAYQLIRTGTAVGGGLIDNDRIRYQLFRTIVDADATFEQGYDITSYKQGKGSSTRLGSVSTLRSPHPDTVLSDQVLDIGFMFREANNKGRLVQSWPKRDASLKPLDKPGIYRLPEDGKPVSVEIYVRITSRAGAQKLAARELDELRPDEWWKIALEDSRLFRRVIPLRWNE